jgi:hypothetical protein
MISRSIVGAAALAVVAPLAFIAGPAQAAAPASSITAVPNDSTPASGQTFRVSGLFIAQGKPADHLVVKMQMMSVNGQWAPVSGAKMLTRSDGTYTMRLILERKGDRELRAIGVVPGPARDAFKRFEVKVH